MSRRLPGAYTLLIAELIERRQQLGMNQRQLAAAIGVRQPMISGYEIGRAAPVSPRLILWADAVGCDLVLVPREREEL